jgi:hypothetical protein
MGARAKNNKEGIISELTRNLQGRASSLNLHFFFKDLTLELQIVQWLVLGGFAGLFGCVLDRLLHVAGDS